MKRVILWCLTLADDFFKGRTERLCHFRCHLENKWQMFAD